MGRYQWLIASWLRAGGVADQQNKAAIGVVLNRMLTAGQPDSGRRQPVIA